MHAEVFDWVESSFRKWREIYPNDNYKVIEIGSLNINGTIRIIFADAKNYCGVDMQTGPGVDLIADSAYWLAPEPVDIIVCCEVFEHAQEWRRIVEMTYKNLKPGGIFIGTAAGEGRFPHSAIDENPIRDWEYYANIGARDMRWTLERNNFKNVIVNTINNDVRWSAHK